MDITPLSFCEFFEIHGSKFKPYPIRDLGEAAVGGITHSVWACQEFCVNEIGTFEKTFKILSICVVFPAYVSHPDPHRRSSLPRMIPQLG